MPLSYSNNLRWRIVWQYYYKQKSIADIQELLFVSSRSLRRYIALFDETGDVSPAIQQHGPPRACLLYTSPSPRDATLSRMPSSA